MKTITQICLNAKCQKQFEASLKELNRGNGKYCCRACSTIHLALLRPAAKVVILLCCYCTKEFTRNASRVGNTTLVYCSRQCKNLAHRNDCHHARTLAFRNFPHCCNRCGWNKEPAVLETHHKDRNRENNDVSNLELLCPTDHCLEHFLARDGKWSKALSHM